MSVVQQLHRKKPNPDGSPSEHFLINEEFVAMFDWLVASCLSAGIADSRNLDEYYRRQVQIYKHFNGNEGMRNWRDDLCAELERWLERFPAAARRANSSLCDVTPGDVLTEVEQVAPPSCML